MPAIQEGQRHARLIDAVVHGRARDIEINSVIRSSWNRCLQRYALDPLRPSQPAVVTREELNVRRKQMGAMYSIARVEMLGLSRQMLHSEYGIVLSDPDGVLLTYVGDPGFTPTARRCGFREGAIWSENAQGTNGMGTCVVEKRPILIHQIEHFLVKNICLTCAAAPIFDLQGRLLAALDISGRASAAQSHTLALVNIAAQNIENRVLLDASRQHFIVRFHRRAEFISTPGEGVIAFDADGKVIGTNRCALDLLSYPDHAALCGETIDQIFDAETGELIHSAAASHHIESLYARRRRLRLFCMVQGPERKASISTGGMPVSRRPADDAPLDGLEFGDKAMTANLRVVRRIADRDISIMLLGETGTGKSRFARAIHAASLRADKPFVSMNCASIPETLIESELFGYRSGAFTGANREGQDGRIVQANGGTLFLDEIGDMPLSLQVRLLSVIEDREVIPLGGAKAVPVDVRIISATHRNLPDAVAKGEFRDDLYYRLNGIALTMPPLRKRGDFAGMLQRLLEMEIHDGEQVYLDDTLVERLSRQHWPGNLRQLRNTLRTMLALRDGDRLTLADYPDERLVGGGIDGLHTADQVPGPESTGNVLGSAERDALQSVLEASHWNVSEAANRLQLSRKTLYRKMHRHGIKRAKA